MKVTSVLFLLLAAIATSKASTVQPSKKPNWFSQFQHPADKDKDPLPEKEEEKKPAIRLFMFRGKKDDKEGDTEVTPGVEENKKPNRFTIKKKGSNDVPHAEKADESKKDESKLNKESYSPKISSDGANSQESKNEETTKIDATNPDDMNEKQVKRKLFRFGVGEKEEDAAANIEKEHEDDQSSTIKTIDNDRNDGENIKAKEESLPIEASTTNLDVNKPSKPRRLRFGVRVNAKESIVDVNATTKTSTNTVIDDKKIVTNVTDVDDDSKPLELQKKVDDENQPSKQRLFRFGQTVSAQGEKSKIDENNEATINATVDNTAGEAVVNSTRSEAKEASKPAPQGLPPAPPMHGIPMGFPMQPQQPGSGLIIMGIDGRPQRGQQDGRHQPGQPPATTAIIAEAIATIISTGIRFWFLTSLTRWFADEEIKSLKKPTQHFVWERLNDRYSRDSDALQTALRTPPTKVSDRKWRRHVTRQLRKEERLTRKIERVTKKGLDDVFDRTVVVMELSKSDKGDFDVTYLEDVVTFILSEYRRKAFGVYNATAVEIEVIILVESPGGGVSEFGLAASQIRRLASEEGIVTTVCVDKVAASGGYMIASQANKVIAAPFAVVGSIGVIREGLNFNKALQKYGVLPMVLTAGEAKAPISTFGEITKGGLEIAQRNLEKIHGAFRDLVVLGRPELADSIEVIADGDIFFGREARDLKLVDEIMTSEEYILEKVQAGDRVLKIHRIPHTVKNRRLASIHPLDFLKENGPRWIAQQDIPKLVSRVLQTSSLLKFVQYLVQSRLF
jgi:serine protease SohB